jgi:hypothetical protein
MVGVTLTTKEGKCLAMAPENRRRVGRDATHLKLENYRFLFLEGWGGTSTALAGASMAPAGTSSDGPAAGGSTPASGTNSTAAPSARGDGGTGSHLSEMARPPSLSSSSSDNDLDNTGGGESPCCCDRTAQNNSVLSPKPVHVAIKQ